MDVERKGVRKGVAHTPGLLSLATVLSGIAGGQPSAQTSSGLGFSLVSPIWHIFLHYEKKTEGRERDTVACHREGRFLLSLSSPFVFPAESVKEL